MDRIPDTDEGLNILIWNTTRKIDVPASLMEVIDMDLVGSRVTLYSSIFPERKSQLELGSLAEEIISDILRKLSLRWHILETEDGRRKVGFRLPSILTILLRTDSPERRIMVKTISFWFLFDSRTFRADDVEAWETVTTEPFVSWEGSLFCTPGTMKNLTTQSMAEAVDLGRLEVMAELYPPPPLPLPLPTPSSQHLRPPTMMPWTYYKAPRLESPKPFPFTVWELTNPEPQNSLPPISPQKPVAAVTSRMVSWRIPCPTQLKWQNWKPAIKDTNSDEETEDNYPAAANRNSPVGDKRSERWPLGVEKKRFKQSPE